MELVRLGLVATGSGACVSEKWKWGWDENRRWRRYGSHAGRCMVGGRSYMVGAALNVGYPTCFALSSAFQQKVLRNGDGEGTGWDENRK
ncbi:unnamed protein product [Miscanthus lutarioriparius]|uniref:Uncharacterized protein n=1 Tax=Miscanthus lutarioriparius TaxID=422564 RepID=A0A811S9R6_9POAL|nr:unnamed protein product [Miscanthus lutarioriparius]